MGKQDEDSVPFWGGPLGIGLLVLLVMGLVTAIYPGWATIGNWMDKEDSSAPAWVQAVGSILAIVFSGVFIVIQHKLELQRQREADLDARRRKLGLIVELARAMKNATHEMNKRFRTLSVLQHLYYAGELMTPEVVKFNDILDHLPLYELDNAAVFKEVIIMQKNCAQYSRIMAELIRDPSRLQVHHFDEGRENLLKIAAECVTSFDVLAKCLEELK